VNYENFFQYFLLLSLLLLVTEFFLSERVKIKERKTPILQKTLTILLLLVSVQTLAQSEKATIKKGNDAYKKNQFETAAAEYQKVITKTPANTIAQFNLGNALYKGDKKDAAIDAYTNAATGAASNLDKSKAYYNKGVVLQNNKKLPECIEAYKNALKLNPQDEDARLNLQKALQQLKQQQSKEQKKPKEDEKKKEQQKKDEEKKQQPKMSKKDAEEKLKALLQQEKNLQDKLRKVNVSSTDKPEKDW
jgi:Ca-activated chloride channel family protein